MQALFYFVRVELEPEVLTSQKNHIKQTISYLMYLSPQQLTLVQTSWSKVVPIAPVAADLFYAKLFELDPSLRPLFAHDMVGQKDKLMKMISFAVDGLSNLDGLVPG